MDNKVVARKEDNSPNGMLQLIQQPNGDTAVQVIPDDGGGLFFSITFRTGELGGGGGSPYTFAALKRLMDAMEKDNRENPSRAV